MWNGEAARALLEAHRGSSGAVQAFPENEDSEASVAGNIDSVIRLEGCARQTAMVGMDG